MRMIFTADFGLKGLMNQYEKKLIKNVIFWMFLLLAGFIYMYYVGGEKVDSMTILCMAIFIMTVCFIQYNQIVPNGMIVNNTVTEVTFDSNRILIKTAPFKVLFWTNKPSKELIFNLSELTVRMVAYPIKSVFDLGNRVIKLTDNEKEVFVIVDYFDVFLKNKLEELAT